MFRTCSPMSILEDRVSELLTYEPGIRDGRQRAIHDARVATRRIREALGLVGAEFSKDELEGIKRIVRKTGRALGDVRDVDITYDLLKDLERRLPLTAGATAPLRAGVSHERVVARRRLIKAIDRLELGSMRQRLPRTGWVGRLRSHGRPSAWKDTLRRLLVTRARDVRVAVHRTGGIYFPNRSHGVRLAIKKLRYALEIAQATGLWRMPAALRCLKRAQDALGNAHDRELLIKRLARIGESPAANRDLETVHRALQAEVEEGQKKYVALRQEILAVCDAAEHVRPSRRGRALIAAGLVVPPLMMLSRRGPSPAPAAAAAESDDIRVRVLVD